MRSTPRQLPWPFIIWLAAFYTAWVAIVFFGDRWSVVQEHWPIAAAMAMGSYFAGSTPMGGGTVGFPVLVLLFDQPATIGRNFSFAVQSIGMVSASILILALRRPLAWRMTGWSLVGATIGTPLGLFVYAPFVPGVAAKLVFAVVWASFGVMTFVKLRELSTLEGMTVTTARFDRLSGLAVGFFGGALITSITGIGVDMLLYVVLVLLVRADLKIAIPSSVVLMAYTSLIGLATNTLRGNIEPEVWANWLAAAPVVAIGAPLGVIIVNYIPRQPTLLIVSVLCIGQFVWTCVNERVAWTTLLAAVLGVLAFNLCFHVMYTRGRRLAGIDPAPVPPAAA
ncbi:MAG: sulfite exporter TauE/SafE family protein [Phycisphaerales bacterium]|nr:MAG: sulfite exporter TauE/SafE family protein [Phycisphaerales bacterium]